MRSTGVRGIILARQEFGQHSLPQDLLAYLYQLGSRARGDRGGTAIYENTIANIQMF